MAGLVPAIRVLRASRREEGGTKMTAYDEQPDIMAIGDSMYQGIRSISFLPAMVYHLSALTDAIGMSMTLPPSGSRFCSTLRQSCAAVDCCIWWSTCAASASLT
jgi:hypothetical protein